jgi:eukaryotic-like serine/threonine-protein kinase
VFPRAGWLIAAAVAIAVIGGHDAALVAAALAPVPLLLRRHGTAWSVPALAPALGALTLSTAYPALAGRAGTWLVRAALGALGAWWLLLWDGKAWPATSELAYLPVFAAAAAILPWLVRGRSLALDVVLAAAWAGALGSATAAVAQGIGAPEPRGLAVGAVLAGVLAVVLSRASAVEA